MTSTVYNATGDWSVAARYTAVGSVDILLSYPKQDPRFTVARYATTMSDDPPAIDESLGHPLLPLDSKPLQLKAGERLWMAGPATLVLEE